MFVNRQRGHLSNDYWQVPAKNDKSLIKITVVQENWTADMNNFFAQ